MLDTDICIYLLTDRAPEKREHILARQPEEPLLLSAVTVSELSYGVEKSKWRKANTALLDRFLCDFQVLPYDEKAARTCGIVRAALEKKGPIGPMDTLIAAHAVSIGATLVTHNPSSSASRSRNRPRGDMPETGLGVLNHDGHSIEVPLVKRLGARGPMPTGWGRIHIHLPGRGKVA